MKKYFVLPLLVVLLTGSQWLYAQKIIVYPPPTPPKEEPVKKIPETPRPISLIEPLTYSDDIIYSPQKATLLHWEDEPYVRSGIRFQANHSGLKANIDHSHLGFDPFIAEWADYDTESKMWTTNRRIESTVDTVDNTMIWTFSERDTETELWKMLVKIDFTFSDQYLFEEKLFSYSLDNTTWQPYLKDQYKRNEEGQLVNVTQRKYVDTLGEWHLDRTIDWWYLPNGLRDVVEEKVHYIKRDITPLQYRTVFTYDQEGKISSIGLQKYDPRENAWKPQYSERFTVNTEGRLETCDWLNVKKMKSIMDYTLLYSGKMNYPSPQVHEETSTGGFYILDKESQRITYDDHGNVSELKRVVYDERYHHPITSYKVVYTYDDRNRLTGIESFSTPPKALELEPEMRLVVRY